MKKYVLVLWAVVLTVFSASALAASPDAASLSREQELAVKWTDAMLIKQQPTAAWKLMSSESQQNIKIAEMNKLSAEITQKLGSFKDSRFVSWNRLPQTDQMVYLMSFEKEKIVRCVFVFDKKEQLRNFALTPLKEKQATKDKK